MVNHCSMREIKPYASCTAESHHHIVDNFTITACPIIIYIWNSMSPIWVEMSAIATQISTALLCFTKTSTGWPTEMKMFGLHPSVQHFNLPRASYSYKNMMLQGEKEMLLSASSANMSNLKLWPSHVTCLSATPAHCRPAFHHQCTSFTWQFSPVAEYIKTAIQ